MAKQKKSFSATIIQLVVVVLVSFLSIRLVRLFNTYEKLEIENEKIEKLLEEERKREEELSSSYSKIGDPEYLTAYAREQLLYSENGSIVIILPDEEEEEE